MTYFQCISRSHKTQVRSASESYTFLHGKTIWTKMFSRQRIYLVTEATIPEVQCVSDSESSPQSQAYQRSVIHHTLWPLYLYPSFSCHLKNKTEHVYCRSTDSRFLKADMITIVGRRKKPIPDFIRSVELIIRAPSLSLSTSLCPHSPSHPLGEKLL